MRFYKLIENGYILAIGTGGGGTEITEQEYNTIMEVIHQKPARTETKDFRLTESLTWEEYNRPPEPEDEEIDDGEALGIITGREANEEE